MGLQAAFLAPECKRCARCRVDPNHHAYVAVGDAKGTLHYMFLGEGGLPVPVASFQLQLRPESATGLPESIYSLLPISIPSHMR